MDEDGEIPEDESLLLAERIRAAVMLALTLFMAWEYFKDRPEVQTAARRVKIWWQRNVTEPRQAEKRLRLAIGETIYDAMEVVEDAGS